MTRSSVCSAHRTAGVRRTTARTGGALAAAGLLLLLAACGTRTGAGEGTSEAPTPSGTPASAASSGSAAASPSEAATPVVSGVYYLIDTRAGVRLAREMRDLAGVDPGKEAVEAMIAGPEDPEYVTTWDPGTEVRSVSLEGDAITVDLSEEARAADVGAAGAARMVQQLVYTVTEALDEQASVQLLIEGEPAGELWGTVIWDRPVPRAEPLDVRMLVQIDSPTEGAVVSSPVTVEGEANVFEANVQWRVIDDSGNVVEPGFTTTPEAYVFAPFSFEVELEPGTYTLEVSESDPSGGEGGEPMTDTRTVTVE
jgi:hypothetical protein